MTQLRLALHDTIATIESPRARQAEYLLFHPTRGSVISVSSTSLQELDLATGALIGEAEFDLTAVAVSANAGSSSAPTTSDRAHALDHLIAVGSDNVVGVFQSRWVIVWDLQDHVLQSICEVEKMQKGMSAIAGSLCRDRWLFYASDGSASIKVTSVDSKEIPKKVSRKASNRSSQITALAYATARRTLCCGSSDGIVQLWSYSEDNVLGGKDEAALATLLFASPATQSPVVQLMAAATGANASYIVVGYQSRAIEVWSLLANTGSKARDPQRVAVTQFSPQQAVDFAKKSGELSLALHPQLPLLIAHWHPFAHSSNSSAIAWEFHPSIGGGSGASSAGGALSDWCELISATARAAAHTRKIAEDDSNHCAAGIGWLQERLVCYRSMHARSLSLLRVDTLDSADGSQPACHQPPTLTSRFTLDLEQYWNYQDIPTHVVQVTANPEPANGASEFILQLVSLQSGTSDKLDDLPAWRNYQGKPLVPWTLVANQSQTVLYLKLKDRSKPASTATDDTSFTYVVMEIKARAGAGNTGGDAASSFRVSCGAQLEALDVCFAEYRSDEARQSRPWVLVVLASSGKSLYFQVKCDDVESARVVLPREALRMFSSPVPLSPQSPHVATVGSRLLFVALDSDGRQTLQLSDDDLCLPPLQAAAAAPGTKAPSWTASTRDEVILDVSWNKAAGASPSSSEASNVETLAAVRTTKRLVILTQSLSQVRAYDLVHDLHEPQSTLWMAQTLLYVTSDNQLRYLAPRRAVLAASASQALETQSRLVCCLAEADRSTAQRTALVAICGDRLAYATSDARALQAKAFVRPVALCEPLAAGFAASAPPSVKLKAIVERDVLVFAMTGGAESPSPLTDYLLHVLYHDFGWRDTTLRLLSAIANPSSTSGSGGSSTGASAGSVGSSYPKTAHLSPPLLASLFVHSHKWRECLQVFLAHDPGLEEYALADEDSGGAATSAKLPSRTGHLALRFRAFGEMLDAVGQSALALKCFDLAGDDLAIVEMARTAGAVTLPTAAATSIVAALQKDWSKLNPPLSALLRAETKNGSSLAQLDSAVWRRHDLFSLLCCDALQQNERRSRLLASVKPFEKLATAVTPAAATSASGALSALDAAACPRASVLPWKRLVPEDTKDWIGVSSTPHFSSDEPKNPSYGFASASALGGTSSGGTSGLAAALSGDLGGASAAGGRESSSDASAKMTIGPFVDEEDAVVAYWRFEEGATMSSSSSSGSGSAGDDTAATSPATAATVAVESLDTSKRENNLQLLGFGSTMSLVSSSAPVDRGEEGRVQEAFALRFPPASSAADGGDGVDESRHSSSGVGDTHSSSDWGARCNVRSGSTLDIGFVFDDDPYRRKLTFEAWVRNYVLARKRDQQLQEQEGDDTDSDAATLRLADDGSRLLACRQSGAARDELWWAFSLVDGHLVLEFAGQSVRSDERVLNAASWHHVAFSVDVLSPKHAAVKLYLQGRCVAAKDVSGVDSVNAKLYAAALAAHGAESSSSVLSSLHLGAGLREYEMTEVRVWAAARTQDQLSDMKENYLGIAEAKKRMKIAIHQRNCQCEKCHARRSKAPLAKLALPMAAFPSTPPSGAVRDRRRPAPKQ